LTEVHVGVSSGLCTGLMAVDLTSYIRRYPTLACPSVVRPGHERPEAWREISGAVSPISRHSVKPKFGVARHLRIGLRHCSSAPKDSVQQRSKLGQNVTQARRGEKQKLAVELEGGVLT